MSKHSQLILAVLCGAIALAVVEMAFTDWRNEAAAHEEKRCQDKSPEFKAMMVRLPGESHSVEWCAQFMKYLSKDFVPEFGSPLPFDKMKLAR